jgi:dienelactone hydrolase
MRHSFIARSVTHVLPVATLWIVAACSSNAPHSGSPAVGAGQAAPAPGTAGTAAQPPVSAAGVSGTTSTSPATAGRSSPPQSAAGSGGSSSAAGTGATSAAGVSGSTSTAGASGMSVAGAGADAGTQAGAPAAGSGGSTSPTMGGLPRMNEEINIKATGPYTVKTYTDGLKVSEYSSAVMYYPEDAAPPFAAVALAPGYTASGTDYEFVGDMLASHGIAALLTTPTDTNADQPPARGDDLVAAVKHLMEENSRQGSPLQGKLATDRICVTGQSMGGGGTLFAANKLGNMIKCALPMEPWQPGGSFPMITAPIMIIGAASDTTAAVSSHAAPHYASIPDSTEKFLVVFEGDHYLSTDRTSGIPQGTPAKANENYDPQAAYMVPFYKLFLEGDERYRPYLYGSMRSMTKVTRFESSKKQ